MQGSKNVKKQHISYNFSLNPYGLQRQAERIGRR